VDGLRLHTSDITFVDDKDTIVASLGTTELTAKAEGWNDMLLALDSKDVCASIKNERYADHLHLELVAPLAVNLNTMHFAFDGAWLAVNDYTLRLEGEVTLGDDIDINATVETDKWQIKPLLALVPEPFTGALSDLDVDGVLQLKADIRGRYNDASMPRVQAHLTLRDGEGQYKPLPYTLRDVVLEADADLNLNQGQRSDVTIHKLQAATKNSQISIVHSQLTDLLGDLSLDLRMALDANLPDFAYFLPEAMHLDGRTQGTLDARIRLDDLTAMRLDKGQIHADLQLKDIRYEMDSMEAVLPNTHALIQLPNTRPSQPTVNWARIDLTTDQVDFAMATPLTAKLQASTVQLEAGNVLSDDPVLYAAVGLQSDQPMEVAMDSMGGTIVAPDLTAYVEYNTQDSAGLKAKATLDCRNLDGFFQDIQAKLNTLHLFAKVDGGHKVFADLSTGALNARIGDELIAQTDTLSIQAASRYNPEGANALLMWNPYLKVNLRNGVMDMPQSLPATVYIPSIEFKYSNREMTIDNSRIELGKSDLNIRGNVRNIGKWFRHEDILEGELDIVSDFCDANQLMDWFSADSGSEESNSPQDDPTANSQELTAERSNSPQDGPFLVPTDVDLAIKTHMREVEVFNQLAKDLKGGLYVKDGTLILDEMGFVCKAAKLQLTAMYRTPRREHLYVGFDYHMIDVDIDELLSMIPNLEEMVPMLASFQGAARFHLAAETYLNDQYQPKMSTLRGAAALTAQDLVVLDGETFSTIAKLLRFKKKTENKIDSINAEITVYKNEIDVYPLCVQMDNYMVALGGRHRTDMTFDYDINVLSPLYLGVHVGGSMDDLKIKLAKCKYAKDFKPHWYQKTDEQAQQLRRRIVQSMEKNVRIQ